MGRKGSRLIPFLRDALRSDKYVNLKFVGNASNTFCLHLPKISCVDKEYQQILKEWYSLKGRTYGFTEKDYTNAKRGMEANIRRSKFLECLQSGMRNELICRILDPKEVKDAKLWKKTKKNSFRNSGQPHSVGSSGYGSGTDSSVYLKNNEDNRDLVSTHAIKHDENNHALLYALGHDHENIVAADAFKSDHSEPVELDGVENIHSAYEATSIVVSATVDQLQESNISNLEMGNTSLVGNESFNSYHINDTTASSNSCQHKEIPAFGDKLPNLENNLAVGGSHTGILSELFNIDECLTPGPENPEVKQLFEELCRELPGFTQPSMENAALPAIDPLLPKMLNGKFYMCSNRQDLPGVVVLTFEPKLMKMSFPFNQDNRSTNTEDPGSLQLIFDEATMQDIQFYKIEEIKLLRNDYVLVILNKCKEPIINNLL